ncbi:hypothetical protein CapIbe_011025 [Capra ibex]
MTCTQCFQEDRSQHLGEELQGYWDQEVLRAQKNGQKPSLMKAIIKCYGKSYLVLGMLTFLEEGTRVVQPIFLGKMVSYVENYDPSDSAALHEAYGYAAGLSACVLVWAVLHHLCFYHMQRVGMRLRVALCRMIYRKTFLLVVGVVGVMVAAIPWTAIPVIPLGIIFFVLRWYFLRTSRDVKRLECTTRSPVFSHVASSLRGLWTIRAYKAEQRFQELFDAYQDLHSEAWFLLLTTSRWLAMYLDVICAIFATVVAFGALILVETLTPEQVGLVLSLTLTLTGMFQWCVRQSTEVENMMISVERGIKYTDLEKEAPWELEYRPPPSWPHGGEIYFYHINFRYSLDGPLVLMDLKALIKPREKLGIVGRTGAGKSSLIAALFRLSEPEGGVWIDGIRISDTGLHDLRKKMSVALQEPVLFTGTMRKNLDPYNEYLEEELWNVLEEVQLKEAIKALPSRLDTELAESGLNLSVGQRQLVCLARTVLRKNQILVLDKATSNVDPRTDELIQKKIHEKFTQCTVLTITHRLSTVIDCEWILVLDSGRRKEYTRPYRLLKNTDSLFYKMVQKLGKAEASALTERARQVHSERK